MAPKAGKAAGGAKAGKAAGGDALAWTRVVGWYRKGPYGCTQLNLWQWTAPDEYFEENVKTAMTMTWEKAAKVKAAPAKEAPKKKAMKKAMKTKKAK